MIADYNIPLVAVASTVDADLAEETQSEICAEIQRVMEACSELSDTAIADMGAVGKTTSGHVKYKAYLGVLRLIDRLTREELLSRQRLSKDELFHYANGLIDLVKNVDQLEQKVLANVQQADIKAAKDDGITAEERVKLLAMIRDSES